jgi:hypothetical protein
MVRKRRANIIFNLYAILAHSDILERCFYRLIGCILEGAFQNYALIITSPCL